MTLGELVSRLQSLPEYQEGWTHIPVTFAAFRGDNPRHDVTDVHPIQYVGVTGKEYREVVLICGGRHEEA